jgi:hypothetical protein
VVRACQACGTQQTPIMTQIPLEWSRLGDVLYLLCRNCRLRIGTEPVNLAEFMGVSA